MSARVSRTTRSTQFGPYAGHIDDGGASMALHAGERLGGPVRRRKGRAFLKLVLVGLIALGGGWAWLNHQATLEAWSAAIVSAISPLLVRDAPAPILASQQPLEPLPLPPLETRELPPATVVPNTATALLPPSSPSPDPEDAAPAEKLPPVVADPSDPLQTRALAIGLHPGLSRALLSRLSAADYKNAEIAIKTALAETPDAQVFAYPRKRTPELALFQVKFVRAATADCRRYVVMVTKDGWLTTAMPMEKCGVGVKQARR